MLVTSVISEHSKSVHEREKIKMETWRILQNDYVAVWLLLAFLSSIPSRSTVLVQSDCLSLRHSVLKQTLNTCLHALLNICANPHLSHWHVDDGLARRSLCFAKLRALFLLTMKLILRETSQCLVFSVFNSCRSSCSLVLVQRKAGRPDWQVVVGWSLGQASLGMGGICLREINFKAIRHMKFFWLTPKIFCIYGYVILQTGRLFILMKLGLEFDLENVLFLQL